MREQKTETEREWPSVEDFVASELPEGADDPYLHDHETPPDWWDKPNPARPKRY